MALRFETKDAARNAVWDALEASRAARFPFPPHGRIPNFADADAAARRLLEIEPWKGARHLKINPDAPQRPLRELALRRGIEVLVPTPRLRDGFRRFDPDSIPEAEMKNAASLSKGAKLSELLPLEKLPAVDAIVAGSVAVTRTGRRCGKGEGYSDIEYAILRELGHPPVPVATSVHPLQVVESFPRDSNDIPLSLIATPSEVIRVSNPGAAPEGIDWDRVSEDDLRKMPVLAQLRALRGPLAR